MSQFTYLFVYGTLMTTANHPIGARLREESDLIGLGWIRARLYHIEDPEDPGQRYPGAVPSGYDNDRVHGEVYALHNGAEALIAAFDIYEACDPSRPEPHEFMRRRVPVTMDDNRVIDAISYLYSWDLSRATRVPSGRFNRHIPQTI